MVTIYFKQQSLKTKKAKEPEDLKRELKVIHEGTPLPISHPQVEEDLKRELKAQHTLLLK
jgi:hypothetical protein